MKKLIVRLIINVFFIGYSALLHSQILHCVPDDAWGCNIGKCENATKKITKGSYVITSENESPSLNVCFDKECEEVLLDSVETQDSIDTTTYLWKQHKKNHYWRNTFVLSTKGKSVSFRHINAGSLVLFTSTGTCYDMSWLDE